LVNTTEQILGAIVLILKAIIYRILRILLLLITAYFVLGDIGVALSISGIDAIIATIYYYFFDKGWDKFEKKIKHWRLEWKYRKMK